MAGKMQDAGLLLIAAIKAVTDKQCAVSITRERPWASITFAGTRHFLEIAYPPEVPVKNIRALAAALPDMEFDLAGHFVADLLVKDIDTEDAQQTGTVILVEALTIIDPVVD